MDLQHGAMQTQVLGHSEAKTEESVAPGRRLSATVPENVERQSRCQMAEVAIRQNVAPGRRLSATVPENTFAQS